MNNKILIVSANYYKEISKNLELGASKTLKENGYEYEIIKILFFIFFSDLLFQY